MWGCVLCNPYGLLSTRTHMHTHTTHMFASLLINRTFARGRGRHVQPSPLLFSYSLAKDLPLTSHRLHVHAMVARSLSLSLSLSLSFSNALV